MKAKNKFQQRVLALSQRLPEITAPQKQWAFKHCFAHIGKRSAKGHITCLECGHAWQEECSPLADAILGCPCPQCTTRLSIKGTRQRVFKQTEYVGIITTSGGFQVIRYFLITSYQKVGQQAQYSCSEVVQRWLSPNGKEAIVARLRGMSALYYDLWNLGAPLEIRSYHIAHNIIPIRFYPRQRVIPEITRNGFNGKYHGTHPLDLFRTILTNNKSETLLKAGQTTLLSHFIRRSTKDIAPYWNSIRICTKNGYTISDGTLWCDYIDLLRTFGKDTNSPKYICPSDLKAEHDRYVTKREMLGAKEQLEEQRLKAQADEARFQELKGKFIGISFDDGEIQVSVLESAEAHFEEGRNLHHCVSSYSLKSNSLILSATILGVRIETIEVSLETLKVVQARGAYNQNTEYHDRIIQLVERNISLIEKRLAA